MGRPDGAHTHGHSGGSGIGAAVLVVLAAALVVKAAGPVVAATAELARVLLIAVAVIVGLAFSAGGALVAYRVHRWRASRVTPAPLPRPVPLRAARAVQEPQRSVAALPAPERPPEVHLHLHGASAQEVAEIMRQVRVYGSLDEHPPAIEED